jgi:threonyl-tRNA synthetase
VLDKMEANPAEASRSASTRARATFYGPKFEYTLRDAIGRDWQCGTTQVDFNLPERFGAFYIDKDSEKKQPVMVHRAICGSLERFLGILIESHAGHMPLWFAPLQVVVATITSEADDYAATVAQKLRKAGLQVETDFATRRSTTRSASIRWPRCRSSWFAACARRRRRPSMSAGWAAAIRRR